MQRFFYKEVFAFFFQIFIVVGLLVLFVVMFQVCAIGNVSLTPCAHVHGQNTGQPGSFIFTYAFCFMLGEGCRIFMYVFKPPRMDWAAFTMLEEWWKRAVVTGVVMVCVVLTWYAVVALFVSDCVALL